MGTNIFNPPSEKDWQFLSTEDLAFWSNVPLIGNAAIAEQAKRDEREATKNKARSDRMAGIEAVDRRKAADREQRDLITRKNQALYDAAANTVLASEAASTAAMITTQGEQKAEQIGVEGTKTLGTQSAMLAATGQIGAGSATGLMENTKANTAKDMSMTISNASEEAGIYTEKSTGYATLAADLGAQATEYEEAANLINPEEDYANYMNAYFGKGGW